MTVAIGCTGGKHRSVAMAEAAGARVCRAVIARRCGCCTGIWAANEFTDRRARWRPRAVRHAVGRPPAHPATSPRWSPSPTTADRRVGCAASSTWCRRVICEWRWPALASDSPHGRLWATIIQHRFGGSGALAGHPIGNLILAGLNEVLADPVAALDELGRILGIHGRVLPMCPMGLGIEADVWGLESDPRMSRVIRGQVAIATTVGKVRRVRLLPGDPPATRQAVDAIMAADLVVLGPGSWFTSVIPHVLVPQLAAALQATTARRALVLNLVAEPGETAEFSAERHIHVLRAARAGVRRARHHRRRQPGAPASVSASSCAAPRTSSMPKLSLLTCPDLVHLYMTRRGWPRLWRRVRVRGMAPTPNIQEPTVPTATVNGPRGDDPWR